MGDMRKWLRRLGFSVQFMTRIPLNINFQLEDRDFAASTVFYPLVGLLVGLVAYLGFLAGRAAFAPRFGAVLFALFSGLWATGGLHLDGFSDTLDGAFSGRSPERCLEIMHDSHVGAYGVIGITANLFVRAVAYSMIYEEYAALGQALCVVPILGRLALVSAACAGRAAQSSVLAKSLIDGVGWREQAATLVLSAALSVWIVGWAAVPLCLFVVILGRVCALWFVRKLGGLTGDVLGFTLEVTEMVILLAFASRLGWWLL